MKKIQSIAILVLLLGAIAYFLLKKPAPEQPPLVFKNQLDEDLKKLSIKNRNEVIELEKRINGGN